MAEYIEKDKAVGIAHDYCHTPDGRCCGPDDVVELYEELQAIPAADVVEVRHGRWEERIVDDPLDPYGFFKKRWYCSSCGRYQTYGTTAFCPCCGARMDGGVNDGT